MQEKRDLIVTTVELTGVKSDCRRWCGGGNGGTVVVWLMRWW
ncbi:hypothetical protein HanXRQr2_Chr12g0532571 [Helianthus annuus]|uniref:Uncharacterized protein n=1 Tax=Helianthus annuus TaxID=4232 RepID=A0A9K3MV77_HELAN|nr:hypothetical protein HanXRQr2_Chr12g0532571 [Helianthus annuus]